MIMLVVVIVVVVVLLLLVVVMVVMDEGSRRREAGVNLRKGLLAGYPRIKVHPDSERMDILHSTKPPLRGGFVKINIDKTRQV
jgi:hypothetical protein